MTTLLLSNSNVQATPPRAVYARDGSNEAQAYLSTEAEPKAKQLLAWFQRWRDDRRLGDIKQVLRRIFAQTWRFREACLLNNFEGERRFVQLYGLFRSLDKMPLRLLHTMKREECFESSWHK